ncbi:PQQ-binding-like beta-propeller repeat protein [Streptomyces sp. R302]|uniref:PQQ-binding-like beta-propeller repeat protein n=1 Tax=unclassified Streptomyces TaxID=2593676 RepID=UPI00145C6597|nr:MULTISPECIES: PQQ-binding-like beta-propeller repeat protein [unclassified Streptomyces]NML50263.1 PQQ-binding-like beta-propeller repeat protein [Streptomyces sp. R301]NML79254.1 PQQ-binding-like beta-propeller repeat protein [Streptomyces sp. R302]
MKLPHDESVKTWGAALAEGRAYVRTDEGLDAYDARSGRKVWSSALEREGRYTGTAGVPEDDRRIPPVFARQGERTDVLFAYTEYVKGSGTGTGRTDVFLRAVDAASGAVSWTVPLPAPGGVRVSDAEPAVVGAEDGVAVVTALANGEGSSEDSEGAVTYAVDLGTRKVTWQQEGFAAGAVDSGVVVGALVPEAGATFGQAGGWRAEEGDLALAGRALDGGAVRWKGEDRAALEVNRVGGGFFATEGSLYDSRTGEAVDGVGGAYTTCHYDQRSVVVCAGDTAVQAVDARSRKVLWTIADDDPSRRMPSVQTAWHGAVYAHAAPDSVILDARTGKDRSTFQGAHLDQVDEYAGLGLDLVVHPATG